ncbi:MAG: adenosylmethionine--8-amino-7-oxononanoate transaminase [Cytophagaceae bacterium]
MNNYWQELDRKLIWHPFTPLQEKGLPLLVESAKGCYLHLSDGRKIIDAVSSWWVNIHGHSNEYIANAIYKQALEMEHVIFAGFTHKPAITIADRLLKILPGDMKRLFFSDNGSTAVEVALKMVMQFWHNQHIKKQKIIALEGSYHGDTFGAMSIGSRGIFTEPFSPYLFEVEFINLENAEQEFYDLVKNNDVAAFIYEPLVQGTAGMRIYPAALLEQLISIAREHDVLCIADEVMTGFGRTGKLFASEYCQLPPDIICMSKGITGGFMPLGATACSERIENVFMNNKREKMFFHGHSYTANALSCAAANASLDLLLKEETMQQIRMIEQHHLAFIERIRYNPNVLNIKCQGTILSIELKTGDETSYFNELRDLLYNFFLSEDILLRPLGNIIYILPPYIINYEELELVYKAIEKMLVNSKVFPEPS